MSRLVKTSLTLAASFMLLATPASAQFGGGWLADYLERYFPSDSGTVQGIVDEPISAIPEPTGALLFAAGAVVIATARRKRS